MNIKIEAIISILKYKGLEDGTGYYIFRLVRNLAFENNNIMINNESITILENYFENIKYGSNFNNFVTKSFLKNGPTLEAYLQGGKDLIDCFKNNIKRFEKLHIFVEDLYQTYIDEHNFPCKDSETYLNYLDGLEDLKSAYQNGAPFNKENNEGFFISYLQNLLIARNTGIDLEKLYNKKRLIDEANKSRKIVIENNFGTNKYEETSVAFSKYN